MCVHACMHVRLQVNNGPLPLIICHLIYWGRFSGWNWTHDLASLKGAQWAPVIHPSLPPQCWRYSCTYFCTRILNRFWGFKFMSSCFHRRYSTKPSPSPRLFWVLNVTISRFCPWVTDFYPHLLFPTWREIGTSGLIPNYQSQGYPLTFIYSTFLFLTVF